MERTGPPARSTGVVAAFAAALLAAGGLTALAPSAAAADTDLARNGGFESGLDGWSCTGNSGAAVSTPAHNGTSALKATPAGADNAKCSQQVAVQPDSTYTLSAWVQGSYVYLGAEGTGTTDVSTWTQSSADWKQLTTTFRTGPSTTRVTVYTHGWFGTPAYYADDLTLVGPGGAPAELPAAPTGLRAGTVTASSVGLSWTGSSGATGYNVYRGDTKVLSVTGTSATVSGLAASTAYGFQVTATNSAGESAKSAPVQATTTAGGGGSGGGGLPAHALVGYLHSSFANGSGYTRMADVPDSWDVIDLAFGEPTSVTSGDIRFSLCPVTECPNVESVAEFKAAIKAKQAAGKKVLISIGGQNGQVQLATTAARDMFVSSVGKIIDEYGLDGLDIDFEGHSLSLNTGDTDFRNPTTPVVVNLISAVKSLKAKYGDKFVLTMAPETFFVQLGYQYYGSGPWGGQDPRAGAYLPVIHALRDELTLLHVQDYNSGSIMGLDNQYHSMGGADFHIAMTDMLLTGFPVAGDQNKVFPALRPDQVAIGLPASTQAGNGHTSPAEVTKALNCLTKKTDCGSYTTHGTWPALRGLMTWSINWDRFNNGEFSKNFDAYFGG
ncbi:glycoside hydrolase family 18 protein [Streptomyces sp. NBC_00053]|uniref:chitinase n=1 Tax=unclassified Streptomyces TaxID=2593676 RepID=UPI00225198E7|nr:MULTISPECIES: glycoside hydrolase family 18 protein [unclassified Streptomyces]WSG55991.1 glycoside hydrolase family 18 protein [Streptomyces sp. NBC_01732]MCX5105493.1 glycoside hydrolase family 18 protein [Streptomyces sp. NBC_00439]MCX5163360.1 glycoside hydrolase family 18 protein [Streptomyces sp. NBC_00305]MCX5221884.1 glycoside hydrolase family 18 protein [Streptomyces sp. NBC_00264]MCX5503582.1 glycoside hydrolase family 18 protein [Streptomyces sp. NBC_00052]